MQKAPLFKTYIMKHFFALFGLLISLHSFAQPKIIFDTDFGNDADDLGALIILNHLENEGECEVLAVMSYFSERDVIAAIDAVNLYYGNGDFPLAVSSHSSYTWQSSYNASISDNFPHRYTNSDVELTVNKYREILAKADDSSVTIVAVGPLGNIKELLESPADDYSILTGKALIEKKVKSFSIMGGGYPAMDNEWNFWGDSEGVTLAVLEGITVPVTIVGYEVGEAIKIGSEFNLIDKNTPLYKGFMHFSANASWMKDNFKGEILDNSCFDEITLLHAIYPDSPEWWQVLGGKRCTVDLRGNNQWVDDATSSHTYMVLSDDTSALRGELLRLMIKDL